LIKRLQKETSNTLEKRIQIESFYLKENEKRIVKKSITSPSSLIVCPLDQTKDPKSFSKEENHFLSLCEENELNPNDENNFPPDFNFLNDFELSFSNL
jgi:hypothetical protein